MQLMYRTTADRTVEAGGVSCVVPRGTTFTAMQELKNAVGIELDPRWVAIQQEWLAHKIDTCRRHGLERAIPVLAASGPMGLCIDLRGLTIGEKNAQNDLADGSISPDEYRHEMRMIDLTRRALLALMKPRHR